MNQADTAWMLMSTALVLLMTPALAFFYGGLVRSKNVLNTMMMSFVSLGVVGVLWALVGYSLAFSGSGTWLGDLAFAGLNGVGLEAKGTIPHVLFMGFQGTFAIITAALISGAIVERMRFSAYVAFIALWALAVYSPVAHWVWGGGWLAQWGALDFAGGTVVHVNAAAAAFVAAIVVGKRTGYGHPRSCRTTSRSSCWARACCGSGGSASTPAARSRPVRKRAWRSSPPCSRRPPRWSCGPVLDAFRTGKPTAVGCATAIVVGLVAVTPAAGLISPMNALLLGAIAAVPSYAALMVRAKTSLDDSLDVVAAHGVGGTVGAMLTGVFAEKSLNGLADGALYGNPGQLLVQGAAVLAMMLYSGLASFVLLKAISLVVSLRADTRAEAEGIDISAHGEEAYSHTGGSEEIEHPTAVPASSPVLSPARAEM